MKTVLILTTVMILVPSMSWARKAKAFASKSARVTSLIAKNVSRHSRWPAELKVAKEAAGKLLAAGWTVDQLAKSGVDRQLLTRARP